MSEYNQYFNKVKENENCLLEVLNYFNSEYENAKSETKIDGEIRKKVSELPSNYENRFSQLQEIEAILRHFEIKMSQKKSDYYKRFLENYNRNLSSSDIKIYIDGQPEIIALNQIINEIALVRNKFLGLTKGFECANYQLSNLSKLLASGCDTMII